MRPTPLIVGACALALLAAGVTVAGQATAAPPPPLTPQQVALGRAALAPNDGWASATTGTTGGSAAAPANVFVVSTRQELVEALGGDNETNGSNATPKIIYIDGVINANEDADGRVIRCDEYAAGTGYTQAAYLAAYDPAVWGWTSKVSGPLEDARAAAAEQQAARVQVRVGPNTTIVGLGRTARFVGGTLLLNKVDNVIIRNIKFQDASDCFPQWDPTDNSPGESPGNWNADYDNLSIVGSTHVWVDHNTFTDQPNIDARQPRIFDRPVQVHDGATDITGGSDYVTLSWNDYSDHDKTHLIGSSNNSTVDPGRLRVTLHHNRYTDILQRAPRVRFGQVDFFNNVFTVADKKPGVEPFVYGLGVGKESAIVAENNYYSLGKGYLASQIIYNWGGTKITAAGNLVKVDDAKAQVVDLVAAYNAANPAKTLAADAGWVPTLRTKLDTAAQVRKLVPANVGAGRIG